MSSAGRAQSGLAADLWSGSSRNVAPGSAEMVFAREPGLLPKFRRGETASLEVVYWAYVDQVTRVAQAVVGSHAAASARPSGGALAEIADLVQEVFTRAFAPEARARFDGARPYGPYLAQIARNVVIDHWRATRRQVPLDLDPLLDALSVEADTSRQPERWADGEAVALVEKYLGALPAELARVHDALYVRGLSQREAAAALGLGRQALRGLEAQLRAGLRRELQRAGQIEGGEQPPSRAAVSTFSRSPR